MPILSGKRPGPYEILSSVGAGRMGGVYRARDTRLEREARAIANLNHPHICILFDIGHQDGIDCLVMEYLEGETLAKRPLKGVLPLEQVKVPGTSQAPYGEQGRLHPQFLRNRVPGAMV